MNTLILSKVENGVGHLRLNSEKTLNSLNQEMVEELFHVLRKWKTDDSVKAVFLDGAGEKAFCAGGDVRRLHQALTKPNREQISPECLKFFISEYTLDYEIHTYSKPIIVWAHGFTMGGGIGIMNGGSHRVVTEKTKLAMPEITIGLYPDVGATWFYNKLPDGYGIFLGLTAARINAGDAIELGLADHYVQSEKREEVHQSIKSLGWKSTDQENHELVTNLLKRFSQGLTLPTPVTRLHAESLKKFSHVKTVAEFKDILTHIPKDEWINESIGIFEHGSPSSAAVTLEQLRRGKNLSLKEVFKSELNLSVHFSQKTDFPEGVRALLVDKDQSPKWSPAKNEDITQEWIESYFKPFWKDSEHPFKDWVE